jgi:hypothetical protein
MFSIYEIDLGNPKIDKVDDVCFELYSCQYVFWL